jgi:hypothetical protein
MYKQLDGNVRWRPGGPKVEGELAYWGKAGKVQNRRQAIAIALNEAGASKYKSERENERHLARTERKEARGTTYQQEREGKSHVGARGRRESSPAMGGKNATKNRRHRRTGAVK